jgi:hypothetical protein
MSKMIQEHVSAANQNHLDPHKLEVKLAKAFKYRVKSGSEGAHYEKINGKILLLCLFNGAFCQLEWPKK